MGTDSSSPLACTRLSVSADKQKKQANSEIVSKGAKNEGKIEGESWRSL